MSEIEATKKYFDSAEDVLIVGAKFLEGSTIFCVVSDSTDDEGGDNWSVYVDLLDFFRITTSDATYTTEEELSNLRVLYLDILDNELGIDPVESVFMFEQYMYTLMDAARVDEDEVPTSLYVS